MTEEKNKIKDIIANISKKNEWSYEDIKEVIRERNFSKLKKVRNKLVKLFEKQIGDDREKPKMVIKDIDDSINLIISTRIIARLPISEEMRNFVSYKFDLDSTENTEKISNTKTEDTRINKKDTIELLNCLTNSNYSPTSNEQAWMKEQVFNTYRSQWLKFKQMKESFPLIFKELKINAIPLIEFYKLLNSPSVHFRDALLNSFLHEVNRNPKSDLYQLAQGMKAEVRPKRLPDQPKTVLYIWLSKKK